MGVLERLNAKWQEDQNGCWLWTAATDSSGYGRIGVSGKNRTAHRVAYELLVGPIPNGLEIDHLCRTRNCVNPAHMEPVTRSENNRRGYSPQAINARKTHCPQGHEYSEENTYFYPGKTHRMCRTCNRQRGTR